jgi:myo-inositol-1(or 4)-monophosphatase
MLHKIIEISKEAGSVIKKGFGEKLTLEYKTNVTDFVTNIDKASEKMIIDFIAEEFPKHNILAEESGGDNKGSEYTWVIDPLDGTMNFANGLPIFAVSIGVIKGAELVAGVVYDVMNDVIFAAEKGSGAFQNDKKISVKNNSELEKAFVVTGFPYNIVDNPDRAMERFNSMLKHATGVRRLGSAALDLCYVANGIFDGFWEVSLKPWDMAAGMLLVKEAGGMLSDFDNKEVTVFTKQLLASNGYLHRSLLDVINLKK